MGVFNNVINNKWVTMSLWPYKFKYEKCLYTGRAREKGTIFLEKILAMLRAHFSGFLE